MLWDEREVSGKRMDRGGDENHDKIRSWFDLDSRRSHPHHKSERPDSVARKGEGDDFAASEARPELKQIGHALEGEVDTPYERDLFDPALGRREQLFAQHVCCNGSRSQDKEYEERETEERMCSEADMAQEVANEVIHRRQQG